MKVMTILGTRPEIIRLSRVMARLDATAGVEHVIVHTGQNYDYELNEIFFDDLGVRSPDVYLDVSRDSLGQAYGDILARSEAAMLEHRPDAVLLLGDTNSAIAVIMAKRLHIPTFHMEAGNRSFDANVPEEVNRRIVDHTADFNLVYTEHARRNLLAEGLKPRFVYLTGSPMAEVLAHQADKIAASNATAELGLTPGEFFVVSAHREENVDHPQRLATLMASLGQLHDAYGFDLVMSLHPRTRKQMERHGIAEPAGLVTHAPFGFSDYCRLQLDSACVLSDSGTITEEASLLGFPAVTIRDSIERPEGLDTGVLPLCGVRPTPAVIEFAMSFEATTPVDYQVLDTSARTVNLILSMTPRAAEWTGLRSPAGDG